MKTLLIIVAAAALGWLVYQYVLPALVGTAPAQPVHLNY